MIINECSEGNIFTREAPSWPAPNKRFFVGDLDRIDVGVDGSNDSHMDWSASLNIAVALCARMPRGHNLKRIVDSETHITVAEIDDSNWHASAMRIRKGCYFIAASRALRAALESESRWFAYLNHATDSDAHRAQVIRYIESILGGIRMGNGWRQYLDVRLSSILTKYAFQLTRLSQLFVVLHELSHIARQHFIDPDESMLGDQHLVEQACDGDALSVLRCRCGDVGADLGEIAASIEILMGTQALLEEVHWWTGPESHPSAPRRRRELANTFDHFMAEMGDQRKYVNYLDMHFPALWPGVLAVTLASGETRSPDPRPLSYSVHALRQVFALRCSESTWVQHGQRYVDGMENVEIFLRRSSFEHYMHLAQSTLNRRILKDVTAFMRKQGVIPSRIFHFKSARRMGFSRRLASYRDLSLALTQVISGQVIFFEYVMPAVSPMELSGDRMRGLDAKAFVEQVEEAFGKEAGRSVLALLLALYKMRIQTVPISEETVIGLCRILSIDPARPYRFTNGEVSSDNSLAAIYGAIPGFQEVLSSNGLEHAVIAPDWFLVDIEKWEREHPDRVTRVDLGRIVED